jgi:hypothetical protein
MSHVWGKDGESRVLMHGVTIVRVYEDDKCGDDGTHFSLGEACEDVGAFGSIMLVFGY